MNKLFLFLTLPLLAAGGSSEAKSLVLTLNDSQATRVYYQLGGNENPRLVIDDDNTFALCGKNYTFHSVKNFYIADEDYTGEAGTIDAIATIDEEGHGLMTGPTRTYTTDGRLLRTTASGRFSLRGLPSGTYVITNGRSTLKIQKP